MASVLWGPVSEADSLRPSAIFGEDDRLDFFEETDPVLRGLAGAVCAIIETSKLSANAAGTEFILSAEPLAQAFGSLPLCSGQRYGDQPLAAHCTAFLVAPDVVVTAGHCLEDECELDRFRFVFGYRMLDETTAETKFSANRIYRGVSLLRRVLNEGVDFAVVRLDRPVTVPEAKPLPVRSSGTIEPGTHVGVIGHPVGLPLKFAFGGSTTVKHNTNVAYFTANLDAFGGNSGSPVINAQTHQVEGIIARGPWPEWRKTPAGCVEASTFSESTRGIDVVRAPLLELGRLLDGGRPTNDQFADRIRMEGRKIEIDADNLHASLEPSEPAHGDQSATKSVWWTWTATEDATVELSTAGSDFDTVLAVYTGGSLNELRLVTSSANGGAAGSSFLVFLARQGTNYQIAVDGRCGLSGQIRLSLRSSSVVEGGGLAQFKNTESITNRSYQGAATPYPSEILVSGMTGVVKRVTVTLAGVSLGREITTGGLEMLLEAPDGRSVLLLNGTHVILEGENLVWTFDDAATQRWETNMRVGSGTYAPPGYDRFSEALPAPAPQPPYRGNLSSLAGGSPNGTWRLFSNSKMGADLRINGGWLLNLETTPNTAPSISPIADQLSASPNQLVSTTFRIGDAETPVGQLLVSVRSSAPEFLPENRILIGGAAGERTLTLAPATGREGAAEVTLTVTDSVGASSRTTFRYTVLGGGNPVMANRTSITNLPYQGTTTPYPSEILVSGMTGVVKRVTVTLAGVNPGQQRITGGLEMLLMAPDGRSVLLLNGTHTILEGENLVWTFDDAATQRWETNMRVGSGTYAPPGYDRFSEALPAPAPQPPYRGNLSSLAGGSPNGTWRLFSNSKMGADLRINGGWLLNLETTPNTAPSISPIADQLSASPNQLVSTTFRIGDAETPAGQLRIGVQSSAPEFLPENRILIGGAAGERTLTLAPATGREGAAEVTLTVTDSVGASSRTTFRYTVLGGGNPVMANRTSITNLPYQGTTTPYPSEILVSGMTGVVKRVTVTLAGVNPGQQRITGGLEMLLEAPDGRSVLLLNGTHVILEGENLVWTFDDAATQRWETNLRVGSGTYAPPGYDRFSEALPAPAPQPPYRGNLSSLAGGSPNGTWRLFSNSKMGADLRINGGWLLNLETTPNTAPSISPIADQLSASPNQLVSTTFRIGDAETPVGQLLVSVQSSAPEFLPENRILIGGAAGERTLTLAPATGREGAAEVTLTVTDSVGASSRTTFRYTVLGGGNPVMANRTSITNLPYQGTTTPYPSEILVSGMTGVVKRVTVTLAGVNPGQQRITGGLEMLLVAPDGRSVLLLNGTHTILEGENLVWTFDDAATQRWETNMRVGSGTYAPPGYDRFSEALPAPAPQPPYRGNLASLAGGSPNGIWRLFSNSRTGADLRISGGWLLNLETEGTGGGNHEPIRIRDIRSDPTGRLAFAWTARHGETYRVVTSVGLGEPMWVDRSDAIVISGDTATFVDQVEQTGHRWFRVVATW